MKEITTETKDDKIEVEMKIFPQLVQDLGGLIDPVTATRVATNIARKCEAAGPPLVAYDSCGEVLKYAHAKTKFDQILSRVKQIATEGQFEPDENNSLDRAIQDAKMQISDTG